MAKLRMEAYQEQERFLAIQENENRELDVSIKQAEKDLGHFKIEEQKLSSLLDSFFLEVPTHEEKSRLMYQRNAQRL